MFQLVRQPRRVTSARGDSASFCCTVVRDVAKGCPGFNQCVSRFEALRTRDRSCINGAIYTVSWITRELFYHAAIFILIPRSGGSRSGSGSTVVGTPRVEHATNFSYAFCAVAVWVAGLAAATASALLAILVGLAVLQLAMASSAKRVIISYSTALIGKVALATLASEYLPRLRSSETNVIV